MTDEVQVGRSMDRRIGEQVFGYEIYHYGKGSPNYFTLVDAMGPIRYLPDRAHERATEAQAWEDCSHFSTDIAAAWTIVDWMLDQSSQILYLLFVQEWKQLGVVASAVLTAERICRSALQAIEQGGRNA